MVFIRPEPSISKTLIAFFHQIICLSAQRHNTQTPHVCPQWCDDDGAHCLWKQSGSALSSIRMISRLLWSAIDHAEWGGLWKTLMAHWGEESVSSFYAHSSFSDCWEIKWHEETIALLCLFDQTIHRQRESHNSRAPRFQNIRGNGEWCLGTVPSALWSQLGSIWGKPSKITGVARGRNKRNVGESGKHITKKLSKISMDVVTLDEGIFHAFCLAKTFTLQSLQ